MPACGLYAISLDLHVPVTLDQCHLASIMTKGSGHQPVLYSGLFPGKGYNQYTLKSIRESVQ